MKAYCPSCRKDFLTDANPPYAVIHTPVEGDGPVSHLHPETREALEDA